MTVLEWLLCMSTILIAMTTNAIFVVIIIMLCGIPSEWFDVLFILSYSIVKIKIVVNTANKSWCISVCALNHICAVCAVKLIMNHYYICFM